MLLDPAVIHALWPVLQVFDVPRHQLPLIRAHLDRALKSDAIHPGLLHQNLKQILFPMSDLQKQGPQFNPEPEIPPLPP